MLKKEKRYKIIFLIICFISFLLIMFFTFKGSEVKSNEKFDIVANYVFNNLPNNSNKEYYEIENVVLTAYNSTEDQTDETPCIAAKNLYICDGGSYVACPRDIKIGTMVEIDDKYYYCVDRTSLKYNGRFDIFFGEDVTGAINFGKQTKTIRVYANKFNK